MKKHHYLLLICSIIFSTASASGKKLKVLFLGNSYTYVNNLPQMTANIAASMGDTLVWDINAPGGQQISGHFSDRVSIGKIKQGGWDNVVLQCQSQETALPDNSVQTDVYPYITLLDSVIKRHNPCAETILYMTWGRKNGDADMCAAYTPQWPYFCSYQQMDSIIRVRYTKMANDNKSVVSPVGAVKHYVRLNYPSIELYQSDESHPSVEGTYAAACAFYTTLFGKDASAAKYDGGLSASVAANIRTAAKKVAYDSLSYWNIGKYKLRADFSYTAIGQQVSFKNNSANAISYNWDLGDGQTSTLSAPSHTYANPGTYIVRMIATNTTCADTTYTTLQLNPTEIKGPSSIDDLVFPNPAHDELNIANMMFVNGDCTITILDNIGKLVYRQPGKPQLIQKINIAHLSAGIYYLQVSNTNTRKTFTFIKE
ncbi:MAG: hypothetical protein BGO70_03180 [Bacteroidetes bacterium 43-93]|nr:T9SS type A sorting domain-containing protein [Bacteroidota bacterium]OJW98903.1 MAG: hypothetical protein BGO70_03180 [Bacteroidetes bacterium 43-93]